MGSTAAVRSALEDLARGFDEQELSADSALAALDDLGAIERLTAGLVARIAKHIDEKNAHWLVGESDAAAFIARKLGVTKSRVHSAIATARRLKGLPEVDEAVRDGKLSAREAELITDAAAHNPAATEWLLESAGHGLLRLKEACIAARAQVEDPSERRRRHHAQRSVRRWTDPDGMGAGLWRFAPEVQAAFVAALEARAQELFRAQQPDERSSPDACLADALADFVLGGATSVAPNYTVHILIDHGALVRDSPVPGETCEIPGVGPVDANWVRDLLGDAFVTALIRKGKDITTVAHLGRHVPAEVMTTLIVRGRECEVENCHARGYLERDHVHGHAAGGPTADSNLAWLCYRHHRLKSDGWELGPPGPPTGKRKLRPPPARAA